MRMGGWTKGLGLVAATMLAIGMTALPSSAKPTVAKCAAAKATASGNALGGSLGCASKARGKGVATSAACVDKATGKLDGAFSKAGALCAGDASLVKTVLAECLTVLEGDVTGSGKCPRAGLHALATAGTALGGCAARDALHPGKGAGCRTHTLSKLGGALGKASACSAASTRDHLTQCWDGVLAALAGTPTTTTTATTSSSAAGTTATTSTSTSLVATTSTSSSTAAPTTTTDAATTSTTSTVADTTTTDGGTTSSTTTTVVDTTTTVAETTSSTSTSLDDTSTTEADTTSTTSTTDTTTTTECASVAQCGGADNACQTRACLEGGICGFIYTPENTIVTDQTPGNCHASRCDGSGNFVETIDDTDTPDDGNECTIDTCAGGVPSRSPSTSGSECSIGVCDGFGNCVECLAAQACPGLDTDCQTRTCIEGTCGFSYTPAGTATTTQAQGDCHEQQCDGSGNTMNVVDNNDADDGNECTLDGCLAGNPIHTPLPDMTPCGGGAFQCNQGFCCAIGQVCG